MPASNTNDGAFSGRLYALDGLRGLALLLVLLEHLLWSSVGAPYRWEQMLLALHFAGWIGVDLFFVLSGFLITGNLYDSLSERRFFRNFYGRRILRIFPLYYATLFVLIGAGMLSGAHWNSHTFWYLAYLQNLSWRGLSQPTDAWWVNLNHFWSLAIEEQFYLLWPLLVFVLRTRKRIAVAAALGIALSWAVRLALWHNPIERVNPYLLYIWTPARLDGLLTGGLLALAMRDGTSRAFVFRAGRPVFWVALAGLVALYLRWPGLPIPTAPALMVVSPAVLAALFGAMLVKALQPGSRTSKLFVARPLRWLGKYSYGMYVFHPMLAAFTLGPLRFWLRAHGTTRSVAVLVSAGVTLLLTMGLAWCSFRYFEAPLLRFKVLFHSDAPLPPLSRWAAAAKRIGRSDTTSARTEETRKNRQTAGA